jgi:hypothetical protein
MLALLAKHNQKFNKTQYEPPRHSVRDVRKWERETGKQWAGMTAAQRQEANDEISRWKARQQQQGAAASGLR